MFKNLLTATKKLSFSKTIYCFKFVTESYNASADVNFERQVVLTIYMCTIVLLNKKDYALNIHNPPINKIIIRELIQENSIQY